MSESAARALCSLSVAPLSWQPGSGSRSRPWSSEVAAAVAAAPRPAQHIAWIRYGGDIARAPDLVRSVVVEATCWRESYPVAQRDRLIPTARAATAEWLEPPQCKTCKGRGTVYHHGLSACCVRCGGTGRVERSERSRAASVDVPWTTWKRTVAPVYARMLGTLEGWDAALLRAVAGQLRG